MSRSLFVRIFFWFWVAMIGVIISLAIVTWLFPHAAVPRGRLPRALHQLQVEGAMSVLRESGPEAFRLHCDRLDDAFHLMTYYVSADGSELNGRVIPAELLSFLDEHRGRILDEGTYMLGAPSRLGIAVEAPDGSPVFALVLGALDVPAEDAASPGDEPVRRLPPEESDASQFELIVPVHILLLRLAAIVLAGGLLCYVLARNLTAPLRRLSDTTARFGSGDLSARADRSLCARGDELGEVGRDFNRMADRLEATISTQQSFLRDASHELRSPLARLGVALGIIDGRTDARGRDAVESAEREIQRMDHLIGQILATTRLDSAETLPPMSRVQLDESLADIVNDARLEAADDGPSTALEVAESVTLTAQPDLLRSALENVIRNALRHHEGDEPIRIRLDVVDDDVARVVIADRGRGVSPTALEQIFAPFHREVDASSESTHAGTGLGLFIARRAVEYHGGTIVASVRDGGGIEVEIRLPRRCGDGGAFPGS